MEKIIPKNLLLKQSGGYSTDEAGLATGVTIVYR